MSFEGQKEGFASIRVKPAEGRSGVMSYSLFHAHEVGNPMIELIGKIVTPTEGEASMSSIEATPTPTSETSTMITVFETSVA